MKLRPPPPLYLLRRFAPEGESPATVVRRYYAAQAWRQKSFLGRLALGAAIACGPIVNIWNLVRYTSRNGLAIRARTGRGLMKQVFDQMKIAALHGLSPKEYYAYELFRDDKRRKVAHYLSWHETNGELIRMLERQDGRTALSRMTDKEAFTAQCRAANLSVVPIFLVVSRDGVRLPAGVQAGDGHPAGLPERDLFFKPIASSIMSMDSTDALGAARWDYLGEGRYKGQGGEILTADELLNRAKGLCAVTDYLIQPRLQNHPGIADLSNGALSSVTIQTFLDERNRPEVVAAVLHLAVGKNTLADNVSLGGLVAAIDIESGTLGPATDSGKRPDVGWRDVHPDTGGQIAGRTLPIWQEALDLARRAHAAFQDRIVVGWDMALTADGPLLIEGDPRGFVTMKQRAYGKPFGEMRYGELLAHHIKRLTNGRQRR